MGCVVFSGPQLPLAQPRPFSYLSGRDTFISGLEFISEGNVTKVRNGAAQLSSMLDREVLDMLKQWLRGVQRANMTRESCLLHAHIAFV